MLFPAREAMSGQGSLGCHDPKLAYGDPLEVTGHTRMSAGLGLDGVCGGTGFMAAAAVFRARSAVNVLLTFLSCMYVFVIAASR